MGTIPLAAAAQGGHDVDANPSNQRRSAPPRDPVRPRGAGRGELRRQRLPATVRHASAGGGVLRHLVQDGDHSSERVFGLLPTRAS